MTNPPPPNDCTSDSDEAAPAALNSLNAAAGGSAAAGPADPATTERDLAHGPREAISSRVSAARVLVTAAACVAVVAGAVIGWRALDGDPASVLVVAGPNGIDAVGSAGEDTDPAPALGTAPTGGSATQETSRSAADGAGEAPAPEEASEVPVPQLTAEALSTGPAASWSEVDTGLEELWGLDPLGDGRVLAYSSRNVAQPPQIDLREVTVVTSDGVEWTEVVLPETVHASVVAASGDRWVVAGWDTAAFPYLQAASRVFVSSDNANTWTEIDVDIPPTAAPVSPWVEPRTLVTDAAVSGDDIVLLASTSAELELGDLAAARGLVPDGQSVLSWSSYGETADTVTLTLVDADWQSDDWFATVDQDSATPDFEAAEVSLEALALTPEEHEALLGSQAWQRLLWSDGESVQVTGTYEAPWGSGAATDDGFVFHLYGHSEGVILESSDGRAWTESPGDPFGAQGAVISDGALWSVVGDRTGSTLTRAAVGAAPQIVAHFPGRTAMRLHAGRAGLAASAVAVPIGEVGDQAIAMPQLRISRDGYELRYDEPPGGTTLWDLTADEAVRVFTDTELEAGGVSGVRERVDESGMWVTFEDPVSGEDLVTFAPDDFVAIEEALMDADYEAYEAAVMGEAVDEQWVGWSADGERWGWQTLSEAFGSDGSSDSDLWLELAVGRDFVVAALQSSSAPPLLDSAAADTFVAETPSVRVFVAPAPGTNRTAPARAATPVGQLSAKPLPSSN